MKPRKRDEEKEREAVRAGSELSGGLGHGHRGLFARIKTGQS